ncbi:MAG: hypothetical protein IJV64_08630, partial [Oscillospiraceae bacterium]|nr:hypothetical protein [Oscillospiraceae bacterium]
MNPASERTNPTAAQPLRRRSSAFGQRPETAEKYREAVQACSSIEYLELNVSQIARMFGFAPTALSNQLRAHFPEVIPRREELRRKLGFADGITRGVKTASAAQYAPAVELLRTSDLTLREAAAQAGVSYTGLRSHVLFYHRELADARLRQREDAAGRKVARGQRGGNGAHREPKPETVAKYAEALRLVQETELTYVEIAARCGV